MKERMRWKTFFALRRGDHFFMGDTICWKTSFCTAANAEGAKWFVNPWDSVRTTQPVRKTPATPEVITPTPPTL